MKKIKIIYIGNKLSKHGNTLTSIESLGSFLEEEGFHIWYASSVKNKVVRLLDMILTTIRYSFKADYVLIDTYSTQNFWFAFTISQLCRVFKLKYIAKLHGGDLPNRLRNSPFFCNLMFNNAYKIIAPSGYLYQAFKLKYAANLSLIPNTIKIDDYPFIERQIDSPKLFWVRSLASIYNPKMAIQVLARLQKKYPNATLCMVGPDKENLMTNCMNEAKKLNVDVEFTGKLSKKKWTKLSESYSVFLNTTHFDNTPVSVIEAMALGLPVVSTNVGGVPYLLEHRKSGLLVNDNDVDAMVAAIEELCADPVLQQELTSNARKIVEKFDWSEVRALWIDVLK